MPSGGLVSTKDLNTFRGGLFDGRLLPGRAVREAVGGRQGDVS
ncbi:hypothetical protein [Streptomyces niveus]|nr:hypothetical protein [Streptomyces niveus]